MTITTSANKAVFDGATRAKPRLRRIFEAGALAALIVITALARGITEPVN